MNETSLKRQAAALRWRILLVLGSAVAAVFMVGATFLYLNALETRHTLVHGVRDHALTISGNFEREVTSAQFLLRGLSQSPSLLDGDLAAFYEQLKRTPKPDGSWFVLWDNQGQILNTIRPYGARLPTRAELGGATDAGYERLRTRGYSISNRVLGPVTKQPVVSVSLRLDDPDGTMSGVLTVLLPQSRLDAVVRDPAKPPAWTSVLLDRQMAIVAASTPDQVPLPRFPEGVPHRLDGPPADWSLLFPDPKDGRLVSIRHSAETDYTTVVSVPQALVDAPVVSVRRQIAAVGAVLLLAGALASLITVRQVGRVEIAAVQTVRRMGVTEARYASLWNDTPEGLFVVNVTTDGRFIYEGFNPAHERATGLSFEDVVGKEPSDFLPPETAAAVIERYRICIEKGAPTVHNDVLGLPAGQRHWQTSLVPVRDPESGRIAALVGISREMTEVVAARQDVREIASRLLSLQEDERQRIASDLHDSTAQHIVAAGLALMLVQKMAGNQPKVREAVADVRAALAEAEKEIRTLSYLLYPPHLRAKGLHAALQSFVRGFSSRTAVVANLRIRGDGDALSTDLQGMILRVVQEALVNVHRHAEATCVTVILRCGTKAVRLRISDNGKGMGRAAASGPMLGVGIPGMEARVRQFGGTMTLLSSAKGTNIRVCVPLDDQGPALGQG